MNGSQGRVGTGTVPLSHIASRRGCEEGSSALVTRDLGGSGFTSRELKEIAIVGWIVEMTVEPPLVEGVVGERSDGPVVVRERLGGDVKAVHARVEEGGVGVHMTCEQGKERKEREGEHVESGDVESQVEPVRDTLLASGEYRRE